MVRDFASSLRRQRVFVVLAKSIAVLAVVASVVWPNREERRLIGTWYAVDSLNAGMSVWRLSPRGTGIVSGLDQTESRLEWSVSGDRFYFHGWHTNESHWQRAVRRLTTDLSRKNPESGVIRHRDDGSCVIFVPEWEAGFELFPTRKSAVMASRKTSES